MWVAGKTGILIKTAVPERLGEEQLIIKHYINKALYF